MIVAYWMSIPRLAAIVADVNQVHTLPLLHLCQLEDTEIGDHFDAQQKRDCGIGPMYTGRNWILAMKHSMKKWQPTYDNEIRHSRDGRFTSSYQLIM